MGITREYMIFFSLAIPSLVGYVVITAAYDYTTKRILFWIGGLMFNLVGCILSFYVPFIHYNQLKVLISLSLFIPPNKK